IGPFALLERARPSRPLPYTTLSRPADAVPLTEVYAAGEPPLVAADGRALARALRVAGRIEPVFVEDVADLPQAVLDFVRDGDVVVVMGAGSISKVPGLVGELA